MTRALNITLGTALGVFMLGYYVVEHGHYWGLYLACTVIE